MDATYNDLFKHSEAAAEKFAADQFKLDYPHLCPECRGDPNYETETPADPSERTPAELRPCETCGGRGRVSGDELEQWVSQGGAVVSENLAAPAALVASDSALGHVTVTTISVTYGRKWNMGNYESATVEISAWGDVEGDPAAAAEELFAFAKKQVKEQSMPLVAKRDVLAGEALEGWNNAN